MNAPDAPTFPDCPQEETPPAPENATDISSPSARRQSVAVTTCFESQCGKTKYKIGLASGMVALLITCLTILLYQMFDK